MAEWGGERIPLMHEGSPQRGERTPWEDRGRSGRVYVWLVRRVGRMSKFACPRNPSRSAGGGRGEGIGRTSRPRERNRKAVHGAEAFLVDALHPRAVARRRAPNSGPTPPPSCQDSNSGESGRRDGPLARHRFRPHWHPSPGHPHSEEGSLHTESPGVPRGAIDPPPHHLGEGDPRGPPGGTEGAHPWGRIPSFAGPPVPGGPQWGREGKGGTLTH